MCGEAGWGWGDGDDPGATILAGRVRSWEMRRQAWLERHAPVGSPAGAKMGVGRGRPE